MSDLRIILIMLALVFNSSFSLGQSNDEFERIINLSNAMQDIAHYVSVHKNYDSQVVILKQHIDNENPIIRKNCFLWLSFIGRNDISYRPYVVEMLLVGMDDKDQDVVNVSYSRLIQLYDKNDFSEKAIRAVKYLFRRQLEMFYNLNTYLNTECESEKDSCWIIYKNNPIYYDVTKLMGYLEIKEIIPDFKQVLLDFRGRWGYNYADYPLMDNPIENYAESRIINPWNIHLALAHMGDTCEIKYCINQFELVVEKNINKPEMIFDPFMKDMVYIMQPQIVPLLKKMLLLSEVDEYFVDFTNRCFRNLIRHFPIIGAEKNISSEIINWIDSNKNNIEINRINALKGEYY